MVSSSPSLARASATDTATGPLTVAEIVLVRRRRGSPLVHTAPGESQAAPPASVTVTSASESGLTFSFHRSLRLFTRLAFVARPPATATTSPRSLRPLILIASLNSSLSVNAVCPSCSAGISTKRAVSAAAPGPATVAAGVLVSCRRGLLLVQIAPETPHARPAGSAIVTSPSPSPSGRTVISNRSRRPSTRRPPVTRPPVTANASSRRLR